MTEAVYTDGTGDYYDLTKKLGDEAEINGALFFASQPDSTSGTGVIQAFVRVQATGDEEGYNTDGVLVYDENSSDSFTHSLLLNEVPIVIIDGVEYYEFRLDINQTNSNPLLSLNELKLYSTSDPNITGEIGSFSSPATLVYDLDDADLDGADDTDNTILLDYSNEAGSGRSDMFFYVAVAEFNGANPATTYVVLYSEFGTTGTLDASDGGDFIVGGDAAYLWGNYTSNDGFEEWSVSKAATGAPIYGYKWADLDADGVWDENEVALGGFRFDYELTYTIEGKGNDPDVTDTIIGTTTTDSTGKYTIFLPGADSYTLTITEVYDASEWFNTYDGDGVLDAELLEYSFTADDLPHIVKIKGVDTLSPDLVSGTFGEADQMNFGNVKFGRIDGYKYEDPDGLLGTTEGRTAWEGVKIELLDGDGIVIETDYTDETGYYSFEGLLPGDYSVRETLPNGSYNLTDITVDLDGNVATVDGEGNVSGFDEQVDFYNTQYGSISGYKYEDADGVEGGVG
ncbi:SdrD B-like domain-containing protein, partial [Altererythrobacter sp. Z27]|uniref:SdrD B-like domain-containing protein n=1 Tax=Altererythrobacter sp. Z27 TaxID=3461147 RepID=UPI004044FAE2